MGRERVQKAGMVTAPVWVVAVAGAGATARGHAGADTVEVVAATTGSGRAAEAEEQVQLGCEGSSKQVQSRVRWASAEVEAGVEDEASPPEAAGT